MLPRKKTTSLSELATSVLDEVQRGQVEKTAASAELVLGTDIGQSLVKIAKEVRSLSQADVTYEDLANFRKTYNV